MAQEMDGYTTNHKSTTHPKALSLHRGPHLGVKVHQTVPPYLGQVRLPGRIQQVNSLLLCFYLGGDAL